MKKTLWVRDDRTTLRNDRYEAFFNYSDRMITAELHVHDFYEVLIFVRGHARFQVEGKIYPLQSGDIILTSPSEIHQVLLDDVQIPYERFVLWIHPEFIERASEFLNGISLSGCFGKASASRIHRFHPGYSQMESIRSCMDRLVELDSSIPHQKALSDLLLTEVLVLLNNARTLVDEDISDCSFNLRINEIIAYINEHLSEDLSLEALSSRFFISRFYLTRQFKEYTSLSLHKFILSKRLLAARRLIEQGTGCLQASVECGFANYSHFSKAFSTAYGVPPSKWKETALKGN